MKGSKRHSFVYKFAQFIMTPVLKKKFNISFENIKPGSSPYILIANHVCNYDPLLVGLSFKQPMYFVASDHLFRMGLLSRLIIFLVSPIPRVKATTETKTVLNIFKRLKDGHNVCIFAEGNSTFTGETGEIPKSIAKLAKRSGLTLITYRLRGGYFSFPRWSRNIRKGKMTGELAHEYSAEEMKNYTDDELDELIKKDLYVNAYDDQKKELIHYKGSVLAENLETALYCCPSCRQFATLKSSDDRLFCSCGLNLRYTDTGYLEPFNETSSPNTVHPDFDYFNTITEWTSWQLDMLNNLVSEIKLSDEDKVIFSDPGQTLLRTIRSIRNVPVVTGILSFYKDRLEISDGRGNDFVFSYADIQDMSIIVQMNIVFSLKSGETYEIHSSFPRSALKYLQLYKELTR